MVTNDSPSITLTEADQKKIILVQNRLTVLQGEVLEATKNLAALEDAIAQGQKNKEYYDNLVETLRIEAVSLEKRRDEIKDEVRASEMNIQQHGARIDDMNVHLSKKRQEHDEREERVMHMNNEATKREVMFAKKEDELNMRESRIHSSERAFKIALESLT